MTDMSKTIAPKSDQLNADDLISKPITIKVTKVSGCDEAAQPIAVYFEGDNGKPYKPCKSMRRVLVNTWGDNGHEYVGRSMTLYRDPTVMFGGIAVGGIRISHLSNIDAPITMALTASRASRKPYTVKPLVATAATNAPAAAPAMQGAPSVADEATAFATEIGLADTPEKFEALELRHEVIASKLSHLPKWKTKLADMMKAQKQKIDPSHILNAG